MADLPKRINACIGAPGCGNRVLPRLQLGQRGFDRTLYRRLLRLPLPTGKRRTIIFDFQGVSGHVPGLA